VRLLFVCERVPWPADNGPSIRTLAQLRALTELGHELELLAFAPTDAPPPPPAGLAVSVTAIDSPGEGSAGDWLRDDADSPLPWHVRQRASAAMAAAVRERSLTADAVVASRLSMTQYLEDVEGALRVYDALDVESLALAQIARLQLGGALARVHAAREAAVVERYERDLAARADLITAVTDADAAELRGFVPDVPVHAVPIGVIAGDYEQLWRPGTPRIAFFGDLGWPPNADAAVHLCREVLPLMPDPPPLTIAGRRPGRALRALAGPGVELTGPLAAMDSALAGDTIAVAPLRAGTGMRVKLLEAMAWGLPVVASPIGCAGIDHAGALVEAEGPQATAAALTALAADASRRRELGAAGRELVARRYGHRQSAELLLAAIADRQAATGRVSRR
jgi:glycosyltransferase involved in cell wall biosynthesis